jgi:hypothetical protein
MSQDGCLSCGGLFLSKSGIHVAQVTVIVVLAAAVAQVALAVG